MEERKKFEELSFALWRYNRGIPEIVFEYFKRFRCLKTSKNCSICFMDFQKNECMLMTPCTHFYHEGCLKTYYFIYKYKIDSFFHRWTNQSRACPVCKQDMLEQLLLRAFENYKNTN
jgi:hypothetical protein